MKQRLITIPWPRRLLDEPHFPFKLNHPTESTGRIFCGWRPLINILILKKTRKKKDLDAFSLLNFYMHLSSRISVLISQYVLWVVKKVPGWCKHWCWWELLVYDRNCSSHRNTIKSTTQLNNLGSITPITTFQRCFFPYYIPDCCHDICFIL